MSNVPETSKEAYRSLALAELNETYRLIISALKVINEGTFEDIAAYLKIDKSRVWKRMSELERMELVYRPGKKKLLKSGRNGFTWMLCNPDKTETHQPPELVTYKPTETSAADFANSIIQQSFEF